MSLGERLHHPATTGIGLRVYAVFLFAFLYLPLAVLAVFSVVDNQIAALPLGSFTWEWWDAAFSNSEVLASIRASVIVAIGAVIIAETVGIPGALLVDRYNFPGKRLCQKFCLLPLILPGEDGTVKVNDATVEKADIEASNGVVHIINGVLVPPAK